MAEYATYRGRGGGLHRFKLPLSPTFAAQVEKGYLIIVGETSSPAPKTLPFGTQIEIVGQHIVPNPAVEKIQEVKDALDSVKDKQVTVALKRPHQVDAKAKWVAYAVAQGMSEDDAKAMTKAELVAKYGH